MKTLHPLLQRQVQAWLGGSCPAGQEEFLRAVSEAYAHFDADRQGLERSLKRKSAEQALRASEASAILETALDCIITIDHEGKITEFNPAAEATFGFCRADVLGRELASLIIPSEFRDQHRRGMARFLATGEGPVLGKRIELPALRADGTVFQAEVAITRIASEGPPVFTGFIRDLTERKQAERALQESEDQLRQAQKMEAIGQLAGGIAHEFNNLLTVISGYSQMLMSSLEGREVDCQRMEVIQKAAGRAADLTRQLLAVGRKQVLEPRVMNLNTVIDAMTRMLAPLLGENIELRTVLCPDLGHVKVDAGKIEQVILNLAVNARDAMPRGGRLTIETANAELDESYSKNHPGATAGSHVMISVRDTGCGMSPEIRARIFEPFFTTKELGKGTGLGLSTVYGVVQQSGGAIEVFSEPGKGATFKIFLPRVRGADVRVDESNAAEPTLFGQETVLLVEDEEMVRNLAHEVLVGMGYRVLVASGAHEALALELGHRGPIDLIVTDVVMPGLSGPEMVAQFLTRRTETRVLYMSGYPNEAIARHGILGADTSFIQKPFSTEAFVRKVRAMLDNTASDRAA